MTAPETLVELAERCEKARGPDRELDRAIANGVIGWPMFAIPGNRSWQFTASLDAAKSLMPSGCNWLKCLDERGHTMFAVYADDGTELGRSIYAGDDAPSLCAAALRAQAKDSK